MPKGYHPQITDSTAVPRQNDTTVSIPSYQDSTVSLQADTLQGPASVTGVPVSLPVVNPTLTLNETRTGSLSVDLPPVFPHETGWNTGRNFLMDNPLSGIILFEKKDSVMLSSVQAQMNQPVDIAVMRTTYHRDWLTGMGLLILILLIWIRIFYGKFFAQLADSITNYQISAKLYLEKNILTRRVSLILDIVYFIVFAVFIYEGVQYTGILETGVSDIALYGMILGILLACSIARIALLRLTGFVFQRGPLFAEYIHHTYIFNKGLGLMLFPVVILMVYIPPGLTVYVLTAGVFVYLLAFVLKAVRAFKIIIRKDVLIFYMILYLCTLEILPLLLGYKLLKALILSY